MKLDLGVEVGLWRDLGPAIGSSLTNQLLPQLRGGCWESARSAIWLDLGDPLKESLWDHLKSTLRRVYEA